MVRERRKSFYEANRRIAHIAEITNKPSKLSTVSTSIPTKKRKCLQPPARSSNRLKGISIDKLNDDILSRKRPKKIANKLENDESPKKDIAYSERPRKIRCRRFTVSLERMNIDTMNELLGIEQPPLPIDTVEVHLLPQTIPTRRCTINLDRMDLSAYRQMPTIQEHGEEVPSSENEPQMLKSRPIRYNKKIESKNEFYGLSPMNILEEIQAPIMDENEFEMPQPIEDVECNTLTNEKLRQQLSSIDTEELRSSVYCRTPDSMSSIYSDQDARNRLMWFTSTPLTPRVIVSQAIQNSIDSNISLERLELLDDELSPRTYSHALIPYRNQLLQSSQTCTQISWRIGPSVSDTSIEVHYAQSATGNFIDDAGIIEPKKCFIDSPYITYGAFIKYKTCTFAVNCFDHNDATIKYHFLSKFCRSYFAALFNGQFNGYLYTTETNARLISKYSNTNTDQVRILRYGEKTIFGDAAVTAIEVPSVPGGALFLFEAENEKSIVHVGDFRLPSELEGDKTLVNSDIDLVQFDQTVTSKLFYDFPPNTDRYIDLMSEAYNFVRKSKENGLSHVFAFGAFEIGMESLLFEMAINFSCKVYMSEERREFLDCMESGDDPDTTIQKLRKKCTDDPHSALIHVFPVEDISMEYLINYITEHNYHRVFGIRPRGNDSHLQTVIETAHKIVDIANPLIGDLSEYERFICVHVQKNLTEPFDHGYKNTCTDVALSQQQN